LGELGLSITQAKVYIVLAKSKCLSAKEISAISHVARPDTYRALYGLEKIGLVEMLLGKSMHFEALPIDECFSSLFLTRVKQTAKLKEKALELTRSFKLSVKIKDTDNFQFMLFSKKASVFTKAQKMTSNAQEQICFLGSAGATLSWLLNDSSCLAKALVRKVYCRIIIPQFRKNTSFQESIETFRDNSSFVLKMISYTPTATFGVWDQKEILLKISPSNIANPAPALWSNNRSIASMCQEYFECLWCKAEKIDLV
jgi:sugar-specific transcriptional regulator TrmB